MGDEAAQLGDHATQHGEVGAPAHVGAARDEHVAGLQLLDVPALQGQHDAGARRHAALGHGRALGHHAAGARVAVVDKLGRDEKRRFKVTILGRNRKGRAYSCDSTHPLGLGNAVEDLREGEGVPLGPEAPAPARPAGRQGRVCVK